MSVLAEGDVLLTLLGVVFVIICVTMIVFVLFRQSDSGGIGAAFGGGEGGALGTKGQSVVDKVIAVMGAAFIILALAYSIAGTSKDTGISAPASDEKSAPVDDRGDE